MNLEKCVQSFLMSLDGLRYRTLSELTEVEYCPCGYKTSNTPPTEGWMPYRSEIALQGMDGHYWLRSTFHTPAVEEGEELILKITTGYEGQADTMNPQGLLYLNGKMVQGLDTNHSEATLEPNTEYELYNYFYVGMIDGATFYRMKLMALDCRAEELYYDVKVPYDCAKLMSPQDDAYHRIMSALVDAVRLTDLRDPRSEAYCRSVEEALAFLKEEFYGKLCSTEGKPVVH